MHSLRWLEENQGHTDSDAYICSQCEGIISVLDLEEYNGDILCPECFENMMAEAQDDLEIDTAARVRDMRAARK